MSDKFYVTINRIGKTPMKKGQHVWIEFQLRKSMLAHEIII